MIELCLMFSKSVGAKWNFIDGCDRPWEAVWRRLMERDRFIYSFFCVCFSLNAGMGPSTTDSVYFVMRRVRRAGELEWTFFLLCPPPPSPSVSRTVGLTASEGSSYGMFWPKNIRLDFWIEGSCSMILRVFDCTVLKFILSQAAKSLVYLGF